MNDHRVRPVLAVETPIDTEFRVETLVYAESR